MLIPMQRHRFHTVPGLTAVRLCAGPASAASCLPAKTGSTAQCANPQTARIGPGTPGKGQNAVDAALAVGYALKAEICAANTRRGIVAWLICFAVKRQSHIKPLSNGFECGKERPIRRFTTAANAASAAG
jgi:hypothetical protein